MHSINKDSFENTDWGNAESSNRYQPKTLDVTKENKHIYTVGVWTLAIVIIISVLGVIYLSYKGKEIPQALIAISSVAIGALASLFSSASK